MALARITIVSPAAMRHNNGNWQTASRWARFLRQRFRVDIVAQWSSALPAPDLLIALHARRSAPSLAALRQAWPQRPAVLVLTGTDVYRDIHSDADAGRALGQASRLVVLQPAALDQLTPVQRAMTDVIYQSAPALKPYQRATRHLDICMIGHLRAEKDPATFMRAAPLLRNARLRLLHIGAALEPELGRLAEATMGAVPRYRWLGNMAHGATRQRLKRCHAMVIASLMEGGANVIIEALTCGVPVLASDVGGNRGMLGADYAGYFPVGDAQALAALIERSAADPVFLATLRRQCGARAALFRPDAEQASVFSLVDNLLHP